MTTDQFAEWRKNTPSRVLLRESLTEPTLTPGGYIDTFERAHRSDLNPGQVANTVMAQFADLPGDDEDDEDEGPNLFWERVIRAQIVTAVERNRAAVATS